MMVDKLTAVPRRRLGRMVGSLASEEVKALNRAIFVFLGLTETEGPQDEADVRQREGLEDADVVHSRETAPQLRSFSGPIVLFRIHSLHASSGSLFFRAARKPWIQRSESSHP